HAKESAAQRRGAEGGNFHQAQVNDRIVDALGVKDIERHADSAGGHHAHDHAGGYDAAADRLEAGDQARQPQAGKEEAAQVEGEDLVLADVWDVQSNQRDADQTDRHVDEKNPAPRVIGHDEPADRRPDHRTQDGGHSQIGHRGDQVGPGDGLQNDQTADGDHHGSAKALQDTRSDHLRQRLRQSAEY